MKKKVHFMCTAFRDGFQSVYGARVFTQDFLPALEAARDAGINYFEAGGGAMFQSPYFYCNEDAFERMDTIRATVGPEANLQTLSRGVNVVGLDSQPSDIIRLHAELFKKHGIESVGYWVPTDGEKAKNTLIYVIKHKSRDAAKASWKAFGADPSWKKVAKESQVDGRILAKRPESTYMETTDYSPNWKNGEADADDVFELRIYKAAKGKLGKLDARFRDHTIKLFNRHGIQSVAYWHPTDEPDSKDNLIYIIKHDSQTAAKKSWQAFIADPDWKKAAKASGVGRLAKPPASTYMKATDYSAIR